MLALRGWICTVLVMVVLGLRTTDVQYPVATGLATPLANSCPIAGKFQSFSRGRNRSALECSLEDARHSPIRLNYFTLVPGEIRYSIMNHVSSPPTLVTFFVNPVFVGDCASWKPSVYYHFIRDLELERDVLCLTRASFACPFYR